MDAVCTVAPRLGIQAACAALRVSRATFYRQRPRLEVPRLAQSIAPPPAQRHSPRALPAAEQAQVLATLHSEEFQNMAPAAVQAQLLDQGRYLCSTRTMYRLLAAQGEVRERRDQLVHPPYQKPELLATGPNQVWSWDITKLRGPVKWSAFYLYVVLDIFSRYVVGWMVAERESAELAKRLIQESIRNCDIPQGQLTVHSDRGRVMRSQPLACLYADLGVTKSFSRPYVSDDNPFSESHFRTLKYRPDFPDRFGCLLDARAHCQVFFPWYNEEHRHSGLAMLTPQMVHFGQSAEVLAQRQRVLDAAYLAHPERFVRCPPRVPSPNAKVWINPPAPKKSDGESH
jgi:putative transposase